MVERADKLENGYIGVSGCPEDVSDVPVRTSFLINAVNRHTVIVRHNHTHRLYS